MKVISGLGRVKIKRSCVAIGIFDGVHRGHQMLLAAMVKEARRRKAVPVVITFFPHPAHVLSSSAKIDYLVSLRHRFKLLETLGVRVCIVIRFTRAFAAIRPETFIRSALVGRLGVQAVFVGEDFRFGKDRRGDIALFKRLGEQYGYVAHGVAPLKVGGEPISSTRLRGLIASGKLSAAQRLLGRPFSVMADVVQSRGRGRRLGYPTANLRLGPNILPPHGVYAVRVDVKGEIRRGVANLGVRPTFKERKPTVHLEVYIFDLNQNLYGQTLEVHFIKKIRNERVFKTPQDLVRQIGADERKARSIL
ncbi:MAG: bifunctional riboflavin kinase/FAD synthetase [Candidatus Omnitrophota bacterium]|nr:bifunctional riboflavin kinase/FAD synthetase [Candidatus Omnitrophota bacterium]